MALLLSPIAHDHTHTACGSLCVCMCVCVRVCVCAKVKQRVLYEKIKTSKQTKKKDKVVHLCSSLYPSWLI